MAGPVPPLAGILETCLYYASDARTDVERFYVETLGLQKVQQWERGIAFRLDGGLLLLFDAEKTSLQGLPHGAVGSGHVCFRVSPSEYEGWKTYLEARGVPLAWENEWDNDARSLYFHDPAGNLLEIADGDMWPA